MNFPAFEAYAAEMGFALAIAPEEQSSDYESGTVQIDRDSWHIRTARNTPTKPGAFVAFWRRGADGVTTPFSEDDPAAGLRNVLSRLLSSHTEPISVRCSAAARMPECLSAT